MSSVMAAVKTFGGGPSVRRRRRCDKQHLELYGDQNDIITCWDTFPAPPITPPAAFLPPGYKRSSSSKKGTCVVYIYVIRTWGCFCWDYVTI